MLFEQTIVKMKVKESEKIGKYLDFVWELKKAIEYEGDSDTSSCWRTRKNSQELEKRRGGGLEIWGKIETT